MSKPDSQKRHHITATISEETNQMMEAYREAHKVEKLPERSELIEKAIRQYIATNP